MNEEKFKKYLENYGRKNNGERIADSSITTIVTNIRTTIPNFFNIGSFFENTNIDEINEFYQKIKKTEFDRNNNRNPSNALKHYPRFLQFQKLKEVMLQYKENPDKFSLNEAYYFFKLNNFNGEYPIKAICREIQNVLKLENDFTTDESINKLKKIFRKDSISFIDIRENRNKREEFLPKLNHIKNIILYGSPGVGKTHNTSKLISLIESGKSEKEIFEIIKNNEHHNGIDISELKERVQFITFHQSFGYEDFIEGFRPNEEGKIGLEKGIFLEICKLAEENLLKSGENKEVPFSDAFNMIFKETIENEESIRIALKRAGSFFNVNDYNDKTIYFEKQSGTTKHTLSIATLEKMYHVEENTFIQGGLAVYYEPILEKLLNVKHTAQIEKTERKNYYLVIDEINRGNISKIFGELITLIEEDKRDTLEVTLPYSKKPFKIPSNLYIIGTMNSTDKSIALIDIALRRRFTFLKMTPKAELIGYPPAKEIFKNLNKQIKEDLGEDYQLGHSYFMKIQDEDDLAFVLKYKIIPLLEEYYYGDDRLKEVIKTYQN